MTPQLWIAVQGPRCSMPPRGSILTLIPVTDVLRGGRLRDWSGGGSAENPASRGLREEGHDTCCGAPTPAAEAPEGRRFGGYSGSANLLTDRGIGAIMTVFGPHLHIGRTRSVDAGPDSFEERS